MYSALFSVLVVLSVLSGRIVDALECYACDNIDHVDKCNNTVHCSNNESCFLDVANSVYRLGCVTNRQCGGLSSVATSIVGRSAKINQETGLDLTQRQINQCFECCSSSNVCNIHLCQHLKPTSCIDDAKADCAWMNSKFNICQNVHEAKSVCPRFCGLCALVDGNWGGWSSWGGCDVTCANGTQTRSRQCTNPTPVSGGLECPGSTTESRPCSFPPCPVTPTVAFRSKDLPSSQYGVGSAILVFGTVLLNVGNGYSSSTGKFTAPLPGTYSFSTQLCLYASSSYYASYAIVHNGSDIKVGHIVSVSFDYPCHNIDEYIILKTNDTVWVRNIGGNGYFYQDSERWNTFSGILVHI